MNSFRETYRQLFTAVEATFQQQIAAGKTYHFADGDDCDLVESDADQIDYDEIGFFEYHAQPGYVLGIDSYGIHILNNEREAKTIDFRDLCSLTDKITIVELLSDS